MAQPRTYPPKLDFDQVRELEDLVADYLWREMDDTGHEELAKNIVKVVLDGLSDMA